MDTMQQDVLETLTVLFLQLLKDRNDLAAWDMMTQRTQSLAAEQSPVEMDHPAPLVCDLLRKTWAAALITPPGIARTRYVDEDHAWVPVILEVPAEGIVVTEPTLLPMFAVDWLLEEDNGWKIDCYWRPGSRRWGPPPR